MRRALARILVDPCRPRLLGGKHAEGFRKALSSDRINADAGGSGQSNCAGPFYFIFNSFLHHFHHFQQLF